MTKKQRAKCSRVIHSASVIAGTVSAGIAQLPGTDNQFIVPIQVNMVMALGDIFGISLDERACEATYASTLATVVGLGSSKCLIRLVPVIGNISNAIIAASITEAIGWYLANQFNSEYRYA